MESAARHAWTPGEILGVAQGIDPDINRVTVYRTLELLKHLGLIDELDLLHLRGHRHFYESHGPRDHIHVACVHCGKVREFESDLYEELKQQISRDCGIEITVSRTEVGGICNDCRQKSRASILISCCTVFRLVSSWQQCSSAVACDRVSLRWGVAQQGKGATAVRTRGERTQCLSTPVPAAPRSSEISARHANAPEIALPSCRPSDSR